MWSLVNCDKCSNGKQSSRKRTAARQTAQAVMQYKSTYWNRRRWATDMGRSFNKVGMYWKSLASLPPTALRLFNEWWKRKGNIWIFAFGVSQTGYTQTAAASRPDWVCALAQNDQRRKHKADLHMIYIPTHFEPNGILLQQNYGLFANVNNKLFPCLSLFRASSQRREDILFYALSFSSYFEFMSLFCCCCCCL